MKSFFYRNGKKMTVMLLLSVLLLSLSGCRGGEWNQRIYTTWSAEWNFTSFWDGLFGWPIAILSYPFAWLCSSIGKLLGNSYVWGIIFTTLIVRTIAWPIYSKQNGTTVSMQIMQPEIDKVQRKYQGRTDPESRQRLSQEINAIYKKYKFNPFGCVITMLLQFPIFVSMYEVVRRINLTTVTTLDGGVSTIVERGPLALMNTKLFNYFDLTVGFTDATTTHDKIFVVVVALIYAGVTFLSQKLAQRKPSYQRNIPNKAPTKGQDQQQMMKTMNNVMIIMFFVMCLSSASLGIYWLVGGVYQIFQSQVGRKLNEKRYYKMKNTKI